MSEGDDPNVWRLVVMRPMQLLVYANTAAATGCFGLALAWALTGWWYPLLHWELALLAAGGFLSLVAFLGAFLQRPR